MFLILDRNQRLKNRFIWLGDNGCVVAGDSINRTLGKTLFFVTVSLSLF